jgi:alanyl-tRNA synthetase
MVRVIQGKTSNYDTDVFTGTIAETSKKVNKVYKAGDDKESIAFGLLQIISVLLHLQLQMGNCLPIQVLDM